MSGAEAIAVLGVISSIISIVDGVKQICDAATNAQGLPKAYRDVAGRLPIVKSILSSAKHRIDKGDVDEESYKAVERIVEDCEKKARKLDKLFHNAFPAQSVSDVKRYYKALKAYGKGNEIESLMKGILEDVQLLASEHGMKAATMTEQEQIVQAIREVSDIHSDLPEPPLTPSSNIPFRRDPDFIARQTLLDQLHEKCAAPAARAAIAGLGGVGKSQLAIEYSYQVRSRSPETWVFWVHASNAARFEQSCRDIADLVRIPGRKDSKADIFKLVHHWLQDENKGKWLLIVDNADDFRWLLETQTPSDAAQVSGSYESSRSLWEHLPQSQHGSVLVTTRSRNVALKLVEEHDIIAVEPMDEAHAVSLFDKKLLIDSSQDDTVKLVAALEFMPLAVVQAAAYINQRAPRCSVRDYIEKFEKTDRSKTGLLAYEAGHLRRDRDAKNSIIITWQISFDSIRQERPSAANLLSLMSFFDRQGIPEFLLRHKYEGGNRHSVDEWRDDGGSDTESSSSEDFEDDIQILRDYSFILVNTDRTSFGMHRLVQLATWEWLEAHRQLERWRQQYIKNLCAEFPFGTYENWDKCGILFPHAQLALAQQPKEDDSSKDWASLLRNAACYALLRGSLIDAEKMSVRSMEVRKKQFGEGDIYTSNSQEIVAQVYILSGRLEEAKDLQVQVVESRQRVLGLDHPDTLTSMSNLALNYSKQGRWEEAELLDGRVLEARKRVLGVEHPDTLANIGNLALNYSKQGRWEEAELLGMQVLEARKRVLGVEHPDTLTSMSNLALNYSKQGRWEEAELLGMQVLEAMKRVLGVEHPDTLTGMSNLAITYSEQGRWEEAELLGMQVLEAMKRVLGVEHPDTMASMSNLAMTYSEQERWEEAELLEMQVLEARKRVLGLNHSDTLTGMSNLAITYSEQGRWEEAELLGMQVLEAMKRVLGVEHPDTLISMNNLALTWKRRNRDLEALELMSSCLEISKRKLGDDHPRTIARAQRYNTLKLESHSLT